MVTFDDYGVSGHANHIATYYGVQAALRYVRSQDIQLVGLKLCSKSMLRKFSGPLDLILSLVCEQRVLINMRPLMAAFGLAAHVSQNALYRQLFIFVSAFTYVATYDLVE